MSEEIKITIIGGGAVGCAIAYELSRNSHCDIAVIEKNSQVRGENQSSRNSGVIHAGIYYPKSKGPLKSRLCVEGNRMLYEFCERYDVPHKKTGKLVVAAEPMEEDYLDDVFRIAVENDVPGVEMIDGRRAALFEPNIRAVSALYVPTSGIIESTSLVDKLYKLAKSAGVMFLLDNEAIEIKPGNNGFMVKIRSRTETETFKTANIINAAGLYSDDLAKIINPDSPYRMDPVKGESAKFYKSKRDNIFMNGLNVYPVPFGYLPGGERLKVSFKEFQKQSSEGKISKSVGVHLTPTLETGRKGHKLGDTVTLGPAYSQPDNKEDYSHKREEKYYLDMIKAIFPNLKPGDISLHQAGIRARLKDHYDFIIERDKKYPDLVNLIGIDSPGLTSSLAIAKYVKGLLAG